MEIAIIWKFTGLMLKFLHDPKYLICLGKYGGFWCRKVSGLRVKFWVHGRDWEVKWNVRCKSSENSIIWLIPGEQSLP